MNWQDVNNVLSKFARSYRAVLAATVQRDYARAIIAHGDTAECHRLTAPEYHDIFVRFPCLSSSLVAVCFINNKQTALMLLGRPYSHRLQNHERYTSMGPLVTELVTLMHTVDVPISVMQKWRDEVHHVAAKSVSRFSVIVMLELLARFEKYQRKLERKSMITAEEVYIDKLQTAYDNAVIKAQPPVSAAFGTYKEVALKYPCLATRDMAMVLATKSGILDCLLDRSRATMHHQFCGVYCGPELYDMIDALLGTTATIQQMMKWRKKAEKLASKAADGYELSTYMMFITCYARTTR